ncbi:MAG TPA: response regulator [Rickettsiales bacterium]|nr:response regulator [Rickettsiales bacterium]
MGQAKNAKNATILLVEDSEDDYEATMRSFKAAHMKNPVQWCKSGKDAMTYLQKSEYYLNNGIKGVNPGPGLVLLDLNMPGIDGRKVLHLIKQDEWLKKIPVIVLTTSADAKDVEQCYTLGASTYIQKPVNFDGLIDAVTRIKEYWFEIALLPGESS